MSFDSIEEAIQDFKNGKMLILVDSPDRENEGDLIVAGEKCTPEHVNFMISHGKGLVCVPITQNKAKKLGLKKIASKNEQMRTTNFSVSVDAVETSTGISAFERAFTIQQLANGATEKDFVQPGHVFPIISKKNVFERQGHTEATIEFCRLAGLKEIGVVCEIIKDNGKMARVPDLVEFKKKHNLKMVSISDLIQYLKKEKKSIASM